MEEPEQLAFLTLRVPRPDTRRELLHTFRMAIDVIEGLFREQRRVPQPEVAATFERLFAAEGSISVPFVYPNVVDRDRRRAMWARCLATSLVVLATPPGDLRDMEEIELPPGVEEEPPPPRRATRAQVNAIPSAPFRDFEEYAICQRTGERLMCSICITNFRSNSRVKQLQCHHMFHTRCINAALQQCAMLCPMCRREVFV
jgi:hypothetical protein